MPVPTEEPPECTECDDGRFAEVCGACGVEYCWQCQRVCQCPDEDDE